MDLDKSKNLPKNVIYQMLALGEKNPIPQKFSLLIKTLLANYKARNIDIL